VPVIAAVTLPGTGSERGCGGGCGRWGTREPPTGPRAHRAALTPGKPDACHMGVALREGEAGRLDWPRVALACRRHLIRPRRPHRPRPHHTGSRRLHHAHHGHHLPPAPGAHPARAAPLPHRAGHAGRPG